MAAFDRFSIINKASIFTESLIPIKVIFKILIFFKIKDKRPDTMYLAGWRRGYWD